MVYMVNDERIRRGYYFAVHLYCAFFLVYAVPGTTGGVKGARALASIPFVFIETLVMFGVHYGVFAPCKGNPAKGVAVADAAI